MSFIMDWFLNPQDPPNDERKTFFPFSILFFDGLFNLTYLHFTFFQNPYGLNRVLFDRLHPARILSQRHEQDLNKKWERKIIHRLGNTLTRTFNKVHKHFRKVEPIWKPDFNQPWPSTGAFLYTIHRFVFHSICWNWMYWNGPSAIDLELFCTFIHLIQADLKQVTFRNDSLCLI